MAKQLNYTTQDNKNYPESYWRVGGCNISQLGKHVLIRVYGYANKVSRDNNDSPIGRLNYVANIEEYNQYFLPSVLKQSNKNHLDASYEFVTDCIDQHDVNGASFFANATNI